MKKKIFKAVLVAVIMGAGFFVWQSQRSELLSDLALANIEHWQEESLRELKFLVGLLLGSVKFLLKMQMEIR